MKNPARYGKVLMAAAAGLLAGCGDGEQAAVQMPPPAVTVVRLEAEPLALTRELPGRAHAYLVAEVRPQVGGIIKERLFAEGGLVKAGEGLYQIDDAVFRAEHQSALARLARAQATAGLARLSAARTGDLLRANAISQHEFDSANAALLQAAADVGVAEAAVASAAVLLGYCRLDAPISGRIGRSAVTRGALVTASQTAPLATIQQLDPIYVDVTQSSAELLALHRELAAGGLSAATEVPVTIRLEDGTPYDQTGTVAFSEVTVNPTTGSYLLRVVVPNPDQILLPGMYVRATVGMGTRAEALRVPQQALSRGPTGETSVLVVGPDGTVEQRLVRVGRAIGDTWLVEEGLRPGERVIIKGLQKVRPGMPVDVTGEEPVNPVGAGREG